MLSTIEEYKAEWNRANAHFLLGYNEPDPSPNHPHSEPNHTKAAEDWVYVQQVAQAFDPPLRLVSPAPASNDFDLDGRSVWLDLFLGNCTDVVPVSVPVFHYGTTESKICNECSAHVYECHIHTIGMRSNTH
jgi:hypothetical protein